MMKHLAAGFLAITLPLATMAQSPAQALIQKVANNEVSVVKQFPSIGNLQGFVIAPKSGNAQKTVIYADKAGQYMIAGAVINANGENVTQADYKKYITDAMAPKVLSAAANTAWFAQGNPKAPHQAYVIVEPNCIACHMLHNALMPMIKSGDLYVRWIMVAFLRENSAGKAAAILQAKDPAAAFTTDEAQFDVKTETGGIQPATTITDDTKAKLKQNFEFMQQFNFISTPVTIYKDKAGKGQIMSGFAPGKALADTLNQMATLD